MATISRTIETEAYHNVPDFEEFYEFNLCGDVRSKPRWTNSEICGGKRLIPARSVNVRLVKGYPAFGATSATGEKSTVYIHRIIAKAFIPNPLDKPNINHIDGDKANFEITNLEWCTHLENMRHAYSTGLAKPPRNGPGELSGSAKLTEDKVREIKRRLALGQPKKSIAAHYGVSPGTVGFIANGQTWGHVSS
jgi:hypothetical protein